MSNVFAREQGISDMEFYRVADKLRTEISVFLMNDKNVPKKWRSVITYPIINLTQAMLDCIIDANAIYPYSNELVERRKALQQLCINYCEKIFERFQYVMNTVMCERLHRDENNTERRRLEYHLDEIGALLEKEERLLHGWKNSTKLMRRT